MAIRRGVLLEVSICGCQVVAPLDAVDRLSLTVHASEIVGICGVEGNGQTEFVERSAVCANPHAGTVLVSGSDVTGKGPLAMREAGLSYIPEDRHNRGLVLDFNLTENMMLGNIRGRAVFPERIGGLRGQ